MAFQSKNYPSDTELNLDESTQALIEFATQSIVIDGTTF